VENSDDYVMLSALQHFVYCPRQFALIHLEQVWQENIYTLRGLRVHERVDTPTHELIAGVRVERSLSLVSHQHQLRGIADVVEFLADGTAYPVEYKSGGKKERCFITSRSGGWWWSLMRGCDRWWWRRCGRSRIYG
jgi:CRISPR-associated exonuclease Cas4